METFLICWGVVSGLVLVCGLCMANIKLVVQGECSKAFLRDVFIVSVFWIVAVIALVFMTIFFSKSALIKVFEGLNL